MLKVTHALDDIVIEIPYAELRVNFEGKMETIVILSHEEAVEFAQKILNVCGQLDGR